MTSRIYLRPPAAKDRDDFLRAVRRSRVLHRPWISAPATPAAYAAYLVKMTHTDNRPYLVCHCDNDALVGVVNLTNIILGSFRSGYLGYYAFAGQARQGFMGEGLKAVVRHAFGTLKMHRLEANIQPENAASIALARACGFKLEGYSPRYLKIGGRWRDHERWAIVAEK